VFEGEASWRQNILSAYTLSYLHILESEKRRSLYS